MNPPAQQEKPPFSRIVAADELPALAGKGFTVKASEAECAALAAANSLVSIARLEARFHIAIGKHDVHLTGEVRARITQECVVTLDPFATDMSEPIDIRFVPEPKVQKVRAGGRTPVRKQPAPVVEDISGDDPPEIMAGGVIDFGVVAAEFFALGLDPYPRKPGAELEIPAEAAPDAGSAGEKPFAALASLRNREPGPKS